MGTFTVEVIISPLGAGSPGQTIDALVHTGTTLCQLPEATARALGLSPDATVTVQDAHGTLQERSVCWAEVRYQDRRALTPVILGPDGCPALLGAVVLETMGLKVDPVRKVLEPTPYLLTWLATPLTGRQVPPSGL